MITISQWADKLEISWVYTKLQILVIIIVHYVDLQHWVKARGNTIS